MKIIIIGAGPVGCYAAKLLRKREDLAIEVIEEHQGVGRPVHCAGLISKEVFSETKIPLDEGSIINHIDGAEFFFNKDNFAIERRNVALVIDRERFDCDLGKGLKVHLNTRCVGIEKEGAGYLVETDKGEHYADIVIGADGANSTLRKIGKFREHIKYLCGVQLRIRYGKCKRNFVRVYMKSPFFAWLIPENESIARVGIISSNPYHDLTDFLKENSIEGEIIEKFAGMVAIGTCSTQMDNVVLVGDAACQVKPMTHGGIYMGMRCAEILSECIINNRLSKYEKEWRAKFSREIEMGLKIRRLYETLGPGTVDRIFSLLKKNKSLLEESADFEKHSTIISTLIKDRRLRGILGDIFLNIFNNIRIREESDKVE